MILKRHENFGLKPNAAFQISTPKIFQFVPRGQKEYKCQILFPSFVWKVNCLSKMTFTRVLLCDTEGLCKVWGQNWILLPKSAQKRFDQFVSSGRKVSKFLILLVSFMWKVNCLNQKVWQEFHFVTEKSHGKMESLGQNWILLFRSAPTHLKRNWRISFQWARRVQISNYFIL